MLRTVFKKTGSFLLILAGFFILLFRMGGGNLHEMGDLVGPENAHADSAGGTPGGTPPGGGIESGACGGTAAGCGPGPQCGGGPGCGPGGGTGPAAFYWEKVFKEDQ